MAKRKSTSEKTRKPDSSVKKSLKNLIAATGDKNWSYNAKTRGFENPTFKGTAPGVRQTQDGAKISRRQTDKNYGLLKAQGYTDYAQKAKARKSGNLKGFKAPKVFPNFSERTFKSREEMLTFLQSVPPDAPFTFRVKLAGTSLVEKYRNNGKDDLDHAFAEQLAFMTADDALATYDESAESKFSEVKYWTLVAKKKIT